MKKLNKKQISVLALLKRYQRLVKQGRMVYISFYLWNRLGGQEEIAHVGCEGRK